MNKQPRRVKLVRPKLQLRLILVFAGMCALSLTLQYILFTNIVAGVAAELPHDGPILMDQVTDLLVAGFLASFGLLLPVTFVIGVLVTHRFAGPVHRFEAFLHNVLRGEQRDDCVLRDGDELGELCRLINEATLPLRQGAASGNASTQSVGRAPNEAPEPTGKEAA